MLDMSCGADVTHTLAAFPRTLYSFVGTNIKKLSRKFCGSDEKKAIAYRHLQCLNLESKPAFRSVGKRVLNFANFIAELPDVDAILPGFCCGYLNVTTELTRRVEDVCTRQGRAGSGEFMGGVVKALFVDAVDFICGRWQTLNDCQTPKLKTLMNAMASRLQSQTESPYKSVVIPVTKVFARRSHQRRRMNSTNIIRCSSCRLRTREQSIQLSANRDNGGSYFICHVIGDRVAAAAVQHSLC